MANNVVVIKDLVKRFDGFRVLDNVSLTIKKNIIYGLLGSNGAGKTTLMHVLIGLLDYDSGNVKILGEDVLKSSFFLKKRVAIVPQKISLYDDLSIFDNLYFFAQAYNLIDSKILAKIDELKNKLMLGDLSRKVKILSGGYKRRVSLAIALIGEPELLILDEALVGIDLETRNVILNLLSELKERMTIILTTHSIRDAEMLCDSICFLHKGKIFLEGETSFVLKKFSQKYKVKIDLFLNDEKYVRLIAKLFGGKKIEAYQNNKVLRLVFYSKDYKALDILSLIQKHSVYWKNIEDVEIHKPGLEEIMVDMIRGEKK